MAPETVKESYFYQQVKAALDNPATHISRIENTAGTGISDISACSNGIEVWIELKVAHGPRVHFRNSQRIWISRRRAAGGRVFVLVRDGDRMLLYDGLGSVTSQKFKQEGEGAFSVLLGDMPTPLFECKKPFKWFELRKELFPLAGIG